MIKAYDNKILKRFMTRNKLRKYLKKYLNKRIKYSYFYFHDGWHLEKGTLKLLEFKVVGVTPIQTNDIEEDCRNFAFQDYEIHFNQDYIVTVCGEAYFYKDEHLGLSINNNGNTFNIEFGG